MDGLFLFNKPILWTSHDAVDFFRRRLGQRKVGHGGTLDPLATGLLLILTGSATRWSERLATCDKDYAGSFSLGFSTDTQDLEGRLMFESAAEGIGPERVREAMAGLTGAIDQRPPAYSAVRQAGRKLYQLARAGAVVDVKTRPVTVSDFELVRFDWPEAFFFLRCSKGTYVRTLCDEAGRRLGCGATMSSLVRLRVGPFRLDGALDEQAVERLSVQDLERRIVRSL